MRMGVVHTLQLPPFSICKCEPPHDLVGGVEAWVAWRVKLEEVRERKGKKLEVYKDPASRPAAEAILILTPPLFIHPVELFQVASARLSHITPSVLF